MNRITNTDLQNVIDRLNIITNSPAEPYTTTDGKTAANLRNYHLSQAYGGVSLHRMANDGGGIRDIFSCGHTTKRELYNRLHAYIAGINAGETA